MPHKAQNPLISRGFRQKRKADFSIKICYLIWWRRRELNPRPKTFPHGHLRAQTIYRIPPSAGR